MPVVKQCSSCNKPFTCNRSHAKTCGSTCRGIQWRANKEQTVPVKLAFSIKHFEAVKTAADNQGMTVSNYIISRSIGAEIATVTTC